MHDYDAELEELRALKKDDHYHFSIDFEYIVKNNGDDDYEVGTATMEIDVDWDDDNAGYRISYYCDSMYEIDPNEGNGDLDSFYESACEMEVLDNLESMGITAELITN